MKSHEFIKAAVDLIGNFDGIAGSSDTPVQANRAVLIQVEPETDDKTDTMTMVAPLQQKLELLKKAVDVDSYYDADRLGGPQSHEPEPGQADPLNDMKRLAGVMFNAEEDTDGLEG